MNVPEYVHVISNDPIQSSSMSSLPPSQPSSQPPSQPPSQQFQSRVNDLYQYTLEEDQLKAQLKEVGNRIKRTKHELLQEVKVCNMQSRGFAIGEKLIKYKMEKKTEGLSQKLLRQALNKYYSNNPAEAVAVMEFILAQRGVTYVDVIDVGKRPRPRVSKGN